MAKSKKPTPATHLPPGCKPGRGQSGVQTTWGARNAAFIAARKAARAGKREEAEAFMATMNKIQTVTAKEKRSIERAASKA
jgi:hypothetical protein